MSNSRISLRDVSTFLSRSFRLVKPYWQSDEKRTAWALLFLVLAIEGTTLYLFTKLSFAMAAMFNSFDARDVEEAWRTTAVWLGLLFVMLFVHVLEIHARFTLIIHWRRFLTRRYLNRYLSSNSYNQLELGDYAIDNPDQRISVDMLNVAEETLSLGLRVISTLGRLLVFTGILWTVSGSLEFTVLDMDVVIPGYMVWLAILYAVFGTWIVHKLAHPLTRLNFAKQAVEADFRYHLVRLRENAESIALLGGESNENQSLNKKFAAIWLNWMELLKYKRRFIAFNFALGQASSVVPYLTAIPAMMSGSIALGGFMQLGQAFGSVQSSLLWFANSYEAIAIWKSSVDRVLSLEDALANAESDLADSDIVRSSGEFEDFNANAITLAVPGNNTLLSNVDLSLKKGEDVIISGPSGSGKSTLFRLLSGLWIWGSGQLNSPGGRTMFLPQKPYLPVAGLREVLTYPGNSQDAVDTDELLKVLKDCGLENFAGDLEIVRDWSRVLSGGEQQRVSIARVFLSKPDWLFLDEATSALDPSAEAELYRTLKARLPDTTIVSIAHRDSLRRFHDLEIVLDPDSRSLSRRQIAI